MLKGVISRLFRGEGRDEVATSAAEKAEFTLQYGDLEVGFLRLSDGIWEFEYSKAFRDQVADECGVNALVEFPDVARVYRSRELWPFFMARIPSTAQPQVREKIERQGLDQKSAAQLLRAFGERSIANPFLLRSA